MTEARQRQIYRDKAEAALDGWGAWRCFTGSLGLRDAVAHAIEAAVADERDRAAPDRESSFDAGHEAGERSGMLAELARCAAIARKYGILRRPDSEVDFNCAYNIAEAIERGEG